MTRQLLFVQGAGEGTHDGWDERLVASLAGHLGSGYAIRYPRMPAEDDPNVMRWAAVLREEIDALGAGAVLVGHSIGATILVHFLADEPPAHPPAGIFLVAMPYIGDGGWPSDEIVPKADLGLRLSPPTAVYLYHGDADDIVPGAHAHLNARAIPQARLKVLPGRDHQLNDDLSEVAADILGLGAGEPV
ncbi:alpha/beta hydrolase [Mesorhizobium sp. BR1-1-16]|uniref:alpha/beta fold hydrolase n=1 Tax=Mesorhizobium sp. BR1-1-16 TaxID=2876653 RepID=UPI001CCF3AF0|nr:alpha/beta fold hydrolase [Mesorhizobium sp. BR1-1-16]MBZ9935384.1 alpha/beta hydrolase [Mesorhizobium sp. BR1-1-16]